MIFLFNCHGHSQKLHRSCTVACIQERVASAAPRELDSVHAAIQIDDAFDHECETALAEHLAELTLRTTERPRVPCEKTPRPGRPDAAEPVRPGLRREKDLDRAAAVPRQNKIAPAKITNCLKLQQRNPPFRAAVHRTQYRIRLSTATQLAQRNICILESFSR